MAIIASFKFEQVNKSCHGKHLAQVFVDSTDVDIEAQINDERLKFVISDSGTPFDPTAKAEVDTTLSAEERGIGGLGIHLIRQIMDTINYERVDGKNVLTLRKKLTKNS